MNETIKHYIRINTDNYITKGLSTAFEQPIETDICINENGGRHFSIEKVINPELIKDGCFLYKYDSGTIRLATDEELQEQITIIEQSTEHIRQQRDQEFILIDKYQLTLVFNELTDTQKAELTQYRIDWLNAPESGIIPTRPLWLM